MSVLVLSVSIIDNTNSTDRDEGIAECIGEALGLDEDHQHENLHIAIAHFFDDWKNKVAASPACGSDVWALKNRSRVQIA